MGEQELPRTKAGLRYVSEAGGPGVMSIRRDAVIAIENEAAALASPGPDLRAIAELGICPVCQNLFREDGHAYDCPLSATPRTEASEADPELERELEEDRLAEERYERLHDEMDRAGYDPR